MNEGPPINFRCLSELVKAIDSPVEEPLPKKVGLKCSPSGINSDRPDFPAQNAKRPGSRPSRFKASQRGLTMKEEIPQQNGEVQSDFDLEALRMNQNFGAMTGVKRAILSVPVRKPNKQWFIRVRLGEEWRFQAALLMFKEENESYLIDPSLVADLGTEVTPTILLTCMNRQDVIFIWPIRLPGPDGRIDNYNRTALEAAAMAQDHWIRVVANIPLGAYEVHKAVANWDDPRWLDISFQKLMEIAFRDKIIRDFSHPALKRLRGEV